jgi:hypothetical protein
VKSSIPNELSRSLKSELFDRYAVGSNRFIYFLFIAFTLTVLSRFGICSIYGSTSEEVARLAAESFNAFKVRSLLAPV